jgi:hypothetical protein
MTRENNGEAKKASGRRVAANRANAKKSTGPRTDEGKARSSRNAVKHGIFATGLRPIEVGEFAEDAEAFRAVAAAYIADLNPRDALEYACAKAIARQLVRLDRLERFESALLEGPIRDEYGVALADTSYEAVGVGFVAVEILQYICGGSDQSDVPAQLVAMTLRVEFGVDRTTLDGVWDDEHEPTDPEGWRDVVEELRATLWPNDQARTNWLMFKSAQQMTGLTRANAATEDRARQALDDYDRLSVVSQRLVRELERWLESWAILRERPLFERVLVNIDEDSDLDAGWQNEPNEDDASSG